MNNSMKTPLIRLAKREGMDKRTVWAIRVGSILLALLLGALVIAISGVNPFKAYGTIITGALGKKTAIRQTVKIAVPLLGCALAIAPCFKMRFWNIGAEGQITAGAIFPMHFWGDFGVTERFKTLPCAADYAEKIMEIRCQGESFQL